MLDQFCVFTKGGVLLWAMSFTVMKGEPVNALIRTCLLEERTGESSFQYTPSSGGSYALKWRLHNGLGLVFVAIYQRSLKLFYVDELLEKVARSFAKQYSTECFEYPEFDASFRKLLKECESKADISKTPTVTHEENSKIRCATDQNAILEPPPSSKPKEDDQNPDIHESENAAKENETDVHRENVGFISESNSGGATAFNAAMLNKLKNPKKGATKTIKKSDKTQTDNKKGKQARRWDNLAINSNKNENNIEKLDFTEGSPSTESTTFSPQELQEKSLVDADEDIDLNELDKGLDAQEPNGLLSSFVRRVGVNMIGTAALTRDDIQPALLEMKKKLMERNVAEEIAEKVTDSVAAGLEGKRLGSFTRISTAVRSAVEEALTRILTPKRSIDILREIKASKSRSKPYTIVFVGVNGVGKSTNLAKVAYWLVQNGIKVMIAACDTFRSGAVEQLKTHCARLSIPLYERGYEKDPAKVAFEAVKSAQKDGRDVVLVDTAGRMQDNEPLMRALSNLINMNDPDLVLFVGEALVGNDAVDQLTKFNRRLADLAGGPNPHLIDGIVLTKFDTIDDKVGAALSMVYTSGAPIMFVGCGQTYVDLKRLNIKSVVASLLK